MRGRRGLQVVVLAAVAAGVGAAVAWWTRPGPAQAHAPHVTPAGPTITIVRRSPSPVRHAPSPGRRAPSPPRLLHGPPLLHHRFVPSLGARAAILVDARDGRVLWTRRARARLPIASTTKIMTALLALERLEPRELVTIRRRVTRVPLVREGLRAGERVAVWKLLDGLLVYSGNDDALALAQAVAGSRWRFVRLMNERAHDLGLSDTHYSTPSGVIDRGNWSSAWDLAALTRVARREPRFRRIVRMRVAHVRWPAPTFAKVYVNKNALLGMFPGADGVKTGWTTVARHCLVASARRDGLRLIAVVLGSGDAFRDARRLLSLGFRAHR